MMIKGLLKKYGQWRRSTEDAIGDCGGSINCGDPAAREDFSNYLGLENYITFEKMFVLEREYENLLNDYAITIEMLEEMGYYNTCNLDNISLELKNLQTLGYNCYFDSNTDRIVLDK